MSDSDISEKIAAIFTGFTTSMKTEDLYTKIGIQRPRFDKYTKSSECIIKSEKAGKTYYWSLIK